MPHETPSCPPWLASLLALRRRYATLGAPGAILAWLPLVVFWLLTGQDFFFRFPLSVLSGQVPLFFLSGEIMEHPFAIQHAGWALDQPTIGKYMLVFALFTCLSIPYGFAARTFCSRETKAQKIAFSFGVSLVTFWALSILSWPAILLFQYISSMGFSFMRLAGLSVCIGSALMWILWAIVMSRRNSSAFLVTLACIMALAGPIIIWIAFFV